MDKAMLKVILAGVSVASLFGSTAVFAQGGGNGNGGTHGWLLVGAGVGASVAIWKLNDII